MQQDLQQRLIRASLDNLAANRPDMDAGTASVDVERFTSPDRLEREDAGLFRRFPLLAGYGSAIPKPGSYATVELGRVPVLLVRQTDGSVAAFINACRHRGTRLVDGPCGHARTFVCPYHAWTWGSDGRLLGVSHGEGFPDLAPERQMLARLPAAERFGMIFVVPTPLAAIEGTSAARFADLDRVIDDWFGPLLADLGSFGFPSHVLHAPQARRYRANWKLLIDGTLETYHFRFAHDRSIYPMFLDNTGVFDWVEPHARMVLPKRSIRDLEGTDPESWAIRPHANLVYSIFPNTLVLVQPDHAMVMTAIPIAPDESEMRTGMLIPEPPATEKASAHWKKNEDIFWSALDEDFRLGERVQSTLRSGADRDLLYGRYEHLLAKWHAALDRAIAA